MARARFEAGSVATRVGGTVLERLCHEFERRHGRPPLRAVRAPGRVNLIGEHTDYNDGLVLPCAIDRDTIVAAAPRDDARVRVFSVDLGAAAEFELPPKPRRSWVDYVAAPWFALAERGLTVPGADLGIASAVPRESGLSSSAALGVAVATALDRVHDLGLGSRQLAELAHRGESGFVGVGCGIMDQFASGLGRRDCALRIDCRDRGVRSVPLGDELRLLVSASGVTRALAHGGYGRRVAECAEVLRSARQAGIASAGATALRDLTVDQLPALEAALDATAFRRARHVITENVRVESTCDALAAGNLEGVGALLRQGMVSLREDYEVSTPELDLLCQLGDAQEGTYGSRLTGAGWGGCTLHLVRPEAAEPVREAIATGFASRFGRRPEILLARASDGAGDLEF